MSVTNPQVSTSRQLSAQDSQALQQVWEKIEATSCPRHDNFHMHTVCSDGRLQPEELMEQATAIGLQNMAITDHHTVNGYEAAQNWLEVAHRQKQNLTLPRLWIGVEINADLAGTEVHLLGYAFNPEHPAIQPYLQGKHAQGDDAQAASVISALHQAGGLAVLAHPARYSRSAEELIPAAAHLGIEGVETYYAYRNPEPWKPSPARTSRVKQLSERYGLFDTCGTDTHGLNLLRRL
ncbi:MAG: PHP domain-containing protein [Cyanobacteria bacterium QS_7_48_42]|nr:MAG: PHP domain-containing protein [Cyanobacteria bacterium QS_7_48_42]